MDTKENVYADWAPIFTQKGYSVIPDKYMSKMPAIKGWSDYCLKLPTPDEMNGWSRSFEEVGSGISVCLGEASGIIALDLDSDDQEILDAILPYLPSSPVEKVGSKGFTRFFQYKGEHTQTLKFNGSMVIELLSQGKKTTLPPSVHVNGAKYRWTGSSTLLDVKREDLPIFPSLLIPNLESILKMKFGDLQSDKHGSFVSGRNNELSSLCAKLIQERKPVDEALRSLIEFDRQTNDPPLFTDPMEMRHIEPYTNALSFYSNHLNSINIKRHRENKEYELPITASGIIEERSSEGEPAPGKLQGEASQRSLNFPELPIAQGAMQNVRLNILENSWVKQDAFAFSASLVLLSTIISRKVVFQGISPNLYVLNVAGSGAGKNSPQEKLKEVLLDARADYLLGAGDYVSDASLMDSLATNPVRLDIMDEAGGILKSISSGKGEYGSKMADILAELYTSSTSKYLGRKTAEGTKGSCFRPNVNILASTTPTGFSEGVSYKSIEKGLLGRFLIFFGDHHQKATRLHKLPRLDVPTLNHLKWWITYQPSSNQDLVIEDIDQNVTELQSDKEASELLDQYFAEFDEQRRSLESHDVLLPVVARLYQQMVKIAIIHACSRVFNEVPTMNKDDVEFAYKAIQYNYAVFSYVVDHYVFESTSERNFVKVLNVIDICGTNGITRRNLFKRTRSLSKREREQVVQDLVDYGEIVVEQGSSINDFVYRRISS